MASESENPEPNLIERLINARNRDLSLFLPIILGLTNETTTSNLIQDQDLTGQDQETPSSRDPRDRIILINSMTQGMVVIEGSSASARLDSLLRDLQGKDGLPPASKASVEAMPVVKIRDGEEGECVICLEEWKAGRGSGLVKEMPCNHKFHGECIEKWLRIRGSCPVCRYKMPTDYDENLNKRGGEGTERRRREVWLTFSFSTESRSGASNQTTSSDSSASDAFYSPAPDTPPTM